MSISATIRSVDDTRRRMNRAIWDVLEAEAEGAPPNRLCRLLSHWGDTHRAHRARVDLQKALDHPEKWQYPVVSLLQAEYDRAESLVGDAP